VAIIFLQLLLNDKELLGEQFVNKPWKRVGSCKQRNRNAQS